MNTYPEQFPEERRANPMRRAEARVFDAIRASNRPGFAHYEWQRDRNSPELDFALWIQDEARFGLQVKGGRYLLEKGKWYLTTQNGREKKSSPPAPDLGRHHVVEGQPIGDPGARSCSS